MTQNKVNGFHYNMEPSNIEIKSSPGPIQLVCRTGNRIRYIYNIYYHIYYILNFGLPVENLKYGFRRATNRDPLFGICSNKTRLLKKTCSFLFKCENSSHFPLLPVGYPMVTRG